MLKYITNKKGDSSIFQILICISILTFLLFFPIISFSYFKFQMSVDDIGLNALRTAMVRGGVDEEVMDTIVTAFETKGYSFEGNTLNGDDGAKVIIWTNTNLCGDSYTFTTQEGKSYNIEIRDWPAGDETSNPNAYYNSDLRRYRNGYSLYKSGDTYTKVENGTEIKLRITVPISAHSKTINALYGLISPNSDTENIFLNEGYGYSVTYSTLSELYQESQITSDIKDNKNKITYVPFELTSDKLSFAGISTEGDVIIPKIFNVDGTNYVITSIGDSTFMNCDKITSVVIPDSVETIGNSVFFRCTNIETITIPSNVKSIGSTAFYECNKLSSISLPPNITRIENGTFGYCYALKEITIPNKVTSIGDSAFYSCGINTIDLPDSLITIEKNAFQYSGLQSVTIPKNVIKIGTHAFNDINIKEVTILGSVDDFGSHAFSNCEKLTNLNLGSKLTTIGEDAFTNCDALTTVVIPSTVKEINSYAFSYCENLTNVTIENGTTTIGSYAFNACNNLKIVTIPNSVTTIKTEAFSNCTSLTNFTVPNSVKTIETKAFYLIPEVFYSGNATGSPWGANSIISIEEPETHY